MKSLPSLYKCQECQQAPCALIDNGLKWCGACWLTERYHKINNIVPLVPLETSESSTI
jgi:hypothetical protein